MGCFLDDLRAFDINADQGTTAAQDKGEWRRTAEQETEYFMAKLIDAEKAPPGVRFADIMTSSSGVTFALFCFVSVFMLPLKPRPFVRSSFNMQAPR